jgi:ribosome biogenesis GTPase
MIESVEPRRSELSRKYRNKEQVIAANVDQVLIVSALAEPPVKLNLVDRMIAAAEKAEILPVLCFNKADLIDPADYQPLLGSYAQLGYPTLLTSAKTGRGLAQLRAVLRDRTTVLAGQSGVGKSTLLNAIQPGLGLRVREVSRATLHGRHTTTRTQLLHLQIGAWVVDTPGIRQFELWDVDPEEVEGYFIEFRPFVPFCKYHNCMHENEQGCAIKDAVARGLISPARYQRYLNLYKAEGQEEEEAGW